MPRSPPIMARTFLMTSSAPGTLRRVWSAARSAGCSQVTAPMPGKVRRERAAGMDDDIVGASVQDDPCTLTGSLAFRMVQTGWALQVTAPALRRLHNRLTRLPSRLPAYPPNA